VHYGGAAGRKRTHTCRVGDGPGRCGLTRLARGYADGDIYHLNNNLAIRHSSEQADKRQIVERASSPQGLLRLEQHRAKTPSGVLARLAARIIVFTASQWLNTRHARPWRHFAGLLV
jgi:hypothetical protein